MSQNSADRRGGIEYYAEDVSVAALTLLNNPLIQEVRVRNHMRAEGIDAGR